MMKTKTGLWALSLFAISGVTLVSCGGDSDGGNENTAGKSPTAGSGTTAGTSSGSGGGSSTAGSGNGGKVGSNNSGGGNGPGPGSDGGDGPDGFGGEANVPACPDDAQGKTCTPTPGAPTVCYSDGLACTCQGQGDSGTWLCLEGGEGGAGPGPDDFMVDCGQNPMAGSQCEGIGLCIGSERCGCYNGSVVCLPG